MTEIPKVKTECQLTSKIFEYINIKSRDLQKFKYVLQYDYNSKIYYIIYVNTILYNIYIYIKTLKDLKIQ